MKVFLIIKRTICIATCVILVFVCSMTSFAQTQESINPYKSVQKVNVEYPIIIIQGIKFDSQYVDEGTENETPYLSSLTVQSAFSAVGSSAIKGLFTFSMDNFMGGIIDYCNDTFKYISCDKNGNSVYNVGAHKYTQSISHYDDYPRGNINEEGILKTAIDRYGADMCYYYSYDWRVDPLDNSDEINALVNQAKSDHNCDKVNMVSASLGGVNALAYIYEYGYDSLNSCVFLSSTLFGTYVATDLFKGEIDFNPEAFYNYLMYLTDSSLAGEIAVKFAYKSGILGNVCSSIDTLAENYSDRIYNELLRDTFGTIPSLWSVILPDEYDECIDFMFSTPELKSEYAGLIKRADDLQKMIKSRDELLDNAMHDGVKISIVSGYNGPLIPAYKRAQTQGDTILETALMTGGATVSDYGKDLGDNYKVEDVKMLSPDKQIDMSTARFPDITWVIKNAPHVACLYGSDYSEFVFKLIESNTQLTVNNFSGYSRFMCVDKAQNFVCFK